MLTVEMKSLHEQTNAAAEFMASKIKTSVKTHGTTIQLENIAAKDVKLLLHKFLHHRGLDNYRVIVVHPGLLEVLSPEHESHMSHESKGSPPTAPVTMPYYFPGSGQGAPKISREKSRKKRD